MNSIYCFWHGGDGGSGQTCPACRDEQLAREQEQLAYEQNYKQNNPGDYDCPSCCFTTLRYGASRCPKCRGSVAYSYWEDIDAAEEAARHAEEAARHKETVCPVCDANVTFELEKAYDSYRVEIICKQCQNRLRVTPGETTLLGPKGYSLSADESLEITEDRLCDQCKYFIFGNTITLIVAFTSFGIAAVITFRIWRSIPICAVVIGYFLFYGAVAITNELPWKDAHCKNGAHNPNLRCKFWEKK